MSWGEVLCFSPRAAFSTAFPRTGSVGNSSALSDQALCVLYAAFGTLASHKPAKKNIDRVFILETGEGRGLPKAPEEGRNGRRKEAGAGDGTTDHDDLGVVIVPACRRRSTSLS